LHLQSEVGNQVIHGAIRVPKNQKLRSRSLSELSAKQEQKNEQVAKFRVTFKEYHQESSLKRLRVWKHSTHHIQLHESLRS